MLLNYFNYFLFGTKKLLHDLTVTFVKHYMKLPARSL
jgi:hypothetical protein